MRAVVTRYWRDLTDGPSAPAEVAEPPPAAAPHVRSPARYLWVMLLAQPFESLPLVRPNCGADMRIIAFVTDATATERILTRIGERPRPPRR